MKRAMGLLLAATMLVAAGPGKVDMAARVLPPAAVPGAAVTPYVKVPAGRIAIVHVRVIDGTGAAAQDDRTVLIDGGRIVAVQAGGDAVPAGYATIDGSGKSVMPGIVGMHDHQYYIARPNLDAAGHSEPPLVIPQMAFSSPRLYHAADVTA